MDLQDYSTPWGEIRILFSRIRWQYVVGAFAVSSVIGFLALASVFSPKEVHAIPVQTKLKLATDFSTNEIPTDISEEEYVLIDTDAGIDDAWAIFICLQAHRNPNIPLKIVAITTTHGNTGVDNVTLNVAQVLNAAQEDNIPVFRGSESALVFSVQTEYNIFVGEDGFGDAHLPVIPPHLEAGHAVQAILKFAEEYKNKGKLTILSIAPLTNLATAIRLKPNIKNLIKAVYILGGNHQGMGNIRPSAEFNFYADAEAAHIVLENFPPTPLHIIPWETVIQMKSNCSFRKDVLGKVSSSEISLLNKIEANILNICDSDWFAVDSLAASILVQSAVATKNEAYFASVELFGDLTRGMMVVDKRSPPLQPPNVIITTETNLNLHEKILLWAAQGSNSDNNQDNNKVSTLK